MVGVIDSPEHITTQWFKEAGDVIVLLGTTMEELGGTEYLRVVHFREQGSPPHLSLESEQAVQACVLQLIQQGLIQSAHDCSDGGLAVTLAESCVSNPCHPLGAVVRLNAKGLRRDAVLFGESQSRVVVSTQASNQERVLSLAKESGVAAEVIGTVGGGRLVVEVEADRLGPGCRIDMELDLVYDRWANGLERALGQVDNP